MAPTRRAILAQLGGVGAVALAGCTGGDSGGGQEMTTATTTTTEAETTTTTTTTSESSTMVQVRSHETHGDILVDGDGMTLYMFEADTQGAGKSACSDSCADAWPPLVGDEPEAGDAVTASLSTFERSGGEMQVAANGWPLYYFASDEAPGDANGQGVDGFGGKWWVLDPAGEPITGGSSSGDTTTTTDDGGGYEY